jgi:HAD superfamily hydrolase (TIGR01509 family)
MIKAVIFDLDGVLVDADKWHFNALNVALQHADIDPISWQEHLTVYKGIPTRDKLQILHERKGLPREAWPRIAQTKHEITGHIIDSFCLPDPEKVEMMRLLKRGYRIAVCSNAVRASVERMLELAGLLPYVDLVLSNQDVAQAKPHPEIYIRAFETLGLQPEECLIVEDSDVGKRAAVASGGILCSVNDPADVNYYRVLKSLREADQINIVIPAGGQGKRFAEVGYQHPKPLIDVLGRPMIAWVLDNFQGMGRPIVLMQQRHIARYCADAVIKQIAPNAEVLPLDGLTEGAACTVLLAEALIANGNELIIANSDQVVDADLMAFVQRMRVLNADGGILTFKDDHPKWSYARVDGEERVVEVAEKVVISDQATVGIYYYKHGRDFVRYARQMIQKNIRVNNEFYVCPVFNEFIADNRSVYIHEIDAAQMHGLGTPENLEEFLQLPELRVAVASARPANGIHAVHVEILPGLRPAA